MGGLWWSWHHYRRQLGYGRERDGRDVERALCHPSVWPQVALIIPLAPQVVASYQTCRFLELNVGRESVSSADCSQVHHDHTFWIAHDSAQPHHVPNFG